MTDFHIIEEALLVVIGVVVGEIHLCYMFINRLWLGARELRTKMSVNVEFFDAFG